MTSLPGIASVSNTASEYDVLDFLARQAIGQIATMALCRVIKVDTAAQLVDVQPMVHQIDGDGNATPHGIIYGLPYARLQGGTCAILIDPVVGDMGVCGFMSRDSSVVKTTRKPGLPGSRRSYDWSDGVYICSVLGATPPTHFIEVHPDTGIKLQTPHDITLLCDTIRLNANVTCTGSIVANGDVSGGGKSLDGHVHSGVTAGSANTGPPV